MSKRNLPVPGSSVAVAPASGEASSPTDVTGECVATFSTTPPTKKVNKRSPASTPIPLLNEDELDTGIATGQDATTRVLDQMPIEEQIQFSGLIGVGPRPQRNPLSRYRLLGNSGLRVSPLCLGTMGFGNTWSAMIGKINKAEAEQIFEQYIQQGGNFIDLALKVWLLTFIHLLPSFSTTPVIMINVFS